MSTLIMPGLRFFGRITDFINSFFFKPASARPLAVLRIGLSFVLLWQSFLIRKSFLDVFSRAGFVQGEVSAILNDPYAPHLNWFIDLLAPIGISENLTLAAFGLFYVISLIFLLCGFFTNGSAFLVWLLHWSFINTGFSGAYGADMYAHIFLFYLIFIPSGHAYSLDSLFKRSSCEPSFQARLGLRVLQLHMCISYLASGLEKASGEQWWNGEVLWVALNTPGYSVADFYWLAHIPQLPMVGGVLVLVIETFYCVMVWPKKTRLLWVFLTCLLHLGIAIFLKLHVFGVLMCIPTLALFAVSSEPLNRLGEKSK